MQPQLPSAYTMRFGFRESWMMLFGLLLGLPLMAQVDWRPVVLEGGDAPIAYMPGLAESRADTVPTVLGAMPYVTHFYQDDPAHSGNRLYMLTVIDYGEGAFPKDSTERVEAFFEATVEAAAEAVAGSVLFSQADDARAYPGWTFRVDYGEGERAVRVRNHMYVLNDRYYHLQVFGFSQDGGERSRSRFFESFRPTPKAVPARVSAG